MSRLEDKIETAFYPVYDDDSGELLYFEVLAYISFKTKHRIAVVDTMNSPITDVVKEHTDAAKVAIREMMRAALSE